MLEQHHMTCPAPFASPPPPRPLDGDSEGTGWAQVFWLSSCRASREVRRAESRSQKSHPSSSPGLELLSALKGTHSHYTKNRTRCGDRTQERQGEAGIQDKGYGEACRIFSPLCPAAGHVLWCSDVLGFLIPWARGTPDLSGCFEGRGHYLDAKQTSTDSSPSQ